MYIASVILLMLVLPAASVTADVMWFVHEPNIALIGMWFVFWGCGVRLLVAGLRQMFQPRFTALQIFDLKEPAANAVVRELGFANVAMGMLGIASLVYPAWLVPAASVGGLYYGLAGLGHMIRHKRNALEWTALVSDLLMFTLLAVFVASRWP